MTQVTGSFLPGVPSSPGIGGLLGHVMHDLF